MRDTPTPKVKEEPKTDTNSGSDDDDVEVIEKEEHVSSSKYADYLETDDTIASDSVPAKDHKGNDAPWKSFLAEHNEMPLLWEPAEWCIIQFFISYCK